MRLHSAEIRNVRHIKDLILDLSAPLTVIAAPNGMGKTTVQQAILAAMFYCDKSARDSFVSRFDPEGTPSVVLGLSRGDPTPTIWLTRYLIDDKGEWKEGGAILKKKKQALDKVQEVLPISADAAALLLWGRQDDMAAVVERFPSNGHSLLTAATIQGAGPDPKKIIRELEKECEEARMGGRGGKVEGALTQAQKQRDALEAELARANSAADELRQRREQFQQAKIKRDELKCRLDSSKKDIDQQTELEKLLDSALQDGATLGQLVETEELWATLEDEIASARKLLTSLKRDLQQLQSQHRVARDQELGRQIETLRTKIQTAEQLVNQCTSLEAELASTNRPGPAEVKQFQALQAKIKQAEARMEASGLRYELSLAEGSRNIRISEDGSPDKEVMLHAGQNQRGIVGRLVIEVDGLRLDAAGKENLSEHKRALAEHANQVDALLGTFSSPLAPSTATPPVPARSLGAGSGVDSFLRLAAERDDLTRALEQARNELRILLSAATLDSIKPNLERLQQARRDNNMTATDQEACAGKVLPSARDADQWRAEKEGACKQAEENLAALEDKRPNDADRALLKRNLEALRKKARESAAAFKNADEAQRNPTREVLEELRRSLHKARKDHDQLNSALTRAAAEVAGLEGQLKQVQPHRALDAIQSDVEEARATFEREQVLQEARALLKERIEATMETLAAHVPIELGKRVTQHLSAFSGNSFNEVRLDQGLAVTHVAKNGRHDSNLAGAEPWQPAQLSFGERHQAALAVKIAVARALAETHGPVFIMLDDSLVSFDPARRTATEEALWEVVGDGRIQVILLTCHTDWALDWKRRQPELNLIDLGATAHYYGQGTEKACLSTPVSLAIAE